MTLASTSSRNSVVIAWFVTMFTVASPVILGHGFRNLTGHVTWKNYHGIVQISCGFNQISTRQALISIPTNFLFLDSDSDGNPDIFEIDNDDDDLTDADELFVYSTNHNDPDSDADGLSDSEELFIYETNPLTDDTDMDGIPDKWEVDNGLNPFVDDATIDRDGDGDNNLQEFQNGTDPNGYLIRLLKGWNLISLAGVPANNTVTSLLEGSVPGVVWYWNNQRFEIATHLESSKGYWVYTREVAEIVVELP